MTDETLKAVQKLQQLATEAGYSLSQMAIAWVLRQPNVSSAIIGATHPQQIEENIKASEITLSENLLKQIDDILDGVASYDR
jgi:aryl-alcohol dehydrogenase-like predicted oxidoreductase